MYKYVIDYRYWPESGNSGNSTIRIDVPIMCTRRRWCTVADGRRSGRDETRTLTDTMLKPSETAWNVGALEIGKSLDYWSWRRVRTSDSVVVFGRGDDCACAQSARYTIMGTYYYMSIIICANFCGIVANGNGHRKKRTVRVVCVLCASCVWYVHSYTLCTTIVSRWYCNIITA